MKKVNVNEEKCIGCGACVAIDSEHFDFNDSGLSSVINNENIDSSSLKSAIESCPTGAISIIEHDDECSCECCENCTNDENCNCGCSDCSCN